MTKCLVMAVLALALSGCAVTSVVGAGISVVGTVVSTTADVAGGAVRTVTGSSDKSEKR